MEGTLLLPKAKKLRVTVNKGVHRQPYVLTISATDQTIRLLEWWVKYSIIKVREAEAVLLFLNSSKYQDSIAQARKSLKDHLLDRASFETKTYSNRVTYSYYTGLFDADGCVYMDYSGIDTKLTQPSCPSILHTINHTLLGSRGKVKNDTDLVFYSTKDNENLLKAMLPFSIVNKQQIALCLDYISGVINDALEVSGKLKAMKVNKL